MAKRYPGLYSKVHPFDNFRRAAKGKRGHPEYVLLAAARPRGLPIGNLTTTSWISSLNVICAAARICVTWTISYSAICN